MAEMMQLRRTYYERVGSLQKKKDQADLELKKLYELRQALIEKNLQGVYSDDVFKEQNKLLEQKIKDIRITQNDNLLEKYNLELITNFIKDKFENLPKTYLNSNLEQKRVLLCSIFPSGVVWSYPGYSNTSIIPHYQAILDIETSVNSVGSVYGSQLEPSIIFSDAQEASLLLEQLNQLYNHLNTTNLNYV